MDEAKFLSRLQVDSESIIPIYVQLVEQIVAAIGKSIHPGDRLPTVRSFAIALGINQNTVQRVFSVLENRGVIEGLRSKGTFIRQAAQPIDEEAINERVQELAEQTISAARSLSLDPQQVGKKIIALLQEK